MNKKINISIVGTGLMGLQHIKAISKSKKANLHSIVDISNNAKNLSKKYKIPLYSHVNELLNSPLGNHLIVVPGFHERRMMSWWKTYNSGKTRRACVLISRRRRVRLEQRNSSY